MRSQVIVAVAASLLAFAVPQAASAKEPLDELVAELNGMVKSEKSRHVVSLARSPESTIVLDSISKIDGKHFRYTVAARTLDPGTLHVGADNGVFVECVSEARCVKTIDASTGQVLIAFGYLEFGPFSASPAEKQRALELVRRVVTLAKGAP